MLFIDEIGQIFRQGVGGVTLVSNDGDSARRIGEQLAQALQTGPIGNTLIDARIAEIQNQAATNQYNRAIQLLGLDANFDIDSVLDNLNETLPGIRDNFAARGLGNSGFTTQALDTQRRAAQRQLDAINLAYDRAVFNQPLPELTSIEDILLEALG